MKMKGITLAVVLTSLAAATAAQKEPASATTKTRGQVDWKATGSLPPGAEYHLIYEDKATHAVQTLVKFARNYSLPTHAHTHDETLVILKGKLAITSDGVETVLEAGSYAVIPGGSSHALEVKGFGACEFLAALNGPFDIKGIPAAR